MVSVFVAASVAKWSRILLVTKGWFYNSLHISSQSIVKSSDVPKGRFEREFPTIWRVSRLAKLSQFDQMYDFSGFFASACQCDGFWETEDMGIYIKRSSKWCVKSWKAFLLNGMTLCGKSLEILWGWHGYGVPGKNKGKSIARFDSLDRDRLDFLRLGKVMKGRGTEWTATIFVSPWGMVMFNQTFNPSCSCESIPATEKAMFRWKVTQADSKRKLQKQIGGYALQCNMQNGAEFLVWSSSIWCFFLVQKYH